MRNKSWLKCNLFFFFALSRDGAAVHIATMYMKAELIHCGALGAKIKADNYKRAERCLLRNESNLSDTLL